MINLVTHPTQFNSQKPVVGARAMQLEHAPSEAREAREANNLLLCPVLFKKSSNIED